VRGCDEVDEVETETVATTDLAASRFDRTELLEELALERVRNGRITVGTRHQDQQALIYISDTGPGIPEEIRTRIYDPFFTTKEVGRGTGQGLAIARAIVRDKHGGDLSFETTLGAGTTFFIRLPIQGKNTPSPIPRSRQRVSSKEKPRF